MRTNTKSQSLSAVPLFADCTRNELSAIGRLCTSIDFDEGAVLTKEGVPGRECFIIASGEAKVVIGKRTVATVGPGECVGEMSLLDGGARTATVTAVTPMVVYVLTAQEFRSLLDASESISRKIMTNLARRLRAAEAKRPH